MSEADHAALAELAEDALRQLVIAQMRSGPHVIPWAELEEAEAAVRTLIEAGVSPRFPGDRGGMVGTLVELALVDAHVRRRFGM